MAPLGQDLEGLALAKGYIELVIISHVVERQERLNNMLIHIKQSIGRTPFTGRKLWIVLEEWPSAWTFMNAIDIQKQLLRTGPTPLDEQQC